MASFFLHILKVVWHGRFAWFWPIWTTITVTIAIVTMWLVRRAPTTAVPKTKEISHTQSRWNIYSPAAVSMLSLLALLIVGYVFVSLKWEVFANYDDSYFTMFTLKGQDLGMMIWRENGRFFPLGHQEFSLIRHFTSSVFGYHLLPFIQLLILSCVLLFLDDELSMTARTTLAAFILILPGIVVSYTGLLFPERNVVFWLCFLVLFVKLFEHTQSTKWAVAAAASAQIMIYYKETACLLLLTFAVARLVLRCRRIDVAGWDFSRLRDKESRLDICFIFTGIIFLLYYVAAMLPHVNMQYAADQQVSLAGTFIYYLKLDLLPWLLGVVVAIRTDQILRRRISPQLLWDGLAFGGVVYFTAYLYLRLTSVYYMAPVDLIAVLYIGRLAIMAMPKMHWWSKATTCGLAVIVLLQCVSLSAFHLFERKNIVHAKAEMADLIVAQYKNNPRNGQRLFFPFAEVYFVTEFASYLSYRGVPMEGVDSIAPGNVAIASAAFKKDEPCVYYRSFVCHAAATPAAGDLVIELPDDSESQSEISPYRNSGELLFFYEPHPRIPESLYPFVGHLHGASSAFRSKELPDRWLHASVTRWK